jgi:polyhydroxyalkanoate synthesis repressor PhaR
MVRLIRRYGGGSRKLYDTEESRYVSLEQLGQWVRQGQELRVVDSKTSEDVTAQTLAQIIYEKERQGGSMLSSAFFHDVIRRGEQVLSSGVEELQQRLDGLIRSSARRLPPVRRARNELDLLRQGLTALDRSLTHLEGSGRRPVRARRHSRPGGSAARATRRRAHS